MAKLAIKLGFAPSFEQTAPGVWSENIVVKTYYADVIRNARRLESSGQVNDDININNRVSIVADPYARENFHSIRWVKFMGTKWKVTDVEVQYPRLIISMGGVYYEDETEGGTSESP